MLNFYAMQSRALYRNEILQNLHKKTQFKLSNDVHLLFALISHIKSLLKLKGNNVSIDAKGGDGESI
jgi:hypothetical protein